MVESTDLNASREQVDERLTSAEERLGALEHEVEALREQLRSVAAVLGAGTDPRRP